LLFFAAFTAQPTILAEDLIPQASAISPYVATLPYGIIATISYTFSKKSFSSFRGISKSHPGSFVTDQFPEDNLFKYYLHMNYIIQV
jgi:hypothetical protein